jgi:hypothetical protein
MDDGGVGAPQSPWGHRLQDLWLLLARFTSGFPSCPLAEGWHRLGGVIQLLVGFVGGCPSSMFSVVPAPLPLVVTLVSF